MFACFNPFPRSFNSVKLNLGVCKGIKSPNCIASTANACHESIRQLALYMFELLFKFFPDYALKIPDDGWVRVRAYDRTAGTIVTIPNARCGFGYRTSRFRSSPGRFVILSVTFRLAEQPLSGPVRYAELAAALGVAIGDRVPGAEARSAVLELRRRKAMVIDPADPDTRSVGSFFVNPVLNRAALAAVEAAVRARCGKGTPVPRFDAGDGLVKVPAAWLIERAGFGRGYSPGDGVRISAKHTLALVNSGSATTAALMALARDIRDGVRDAFGVSLAPEPDLVGVAL